MGALVRRLVVSCVILIAATSPALSVPFTISAGTDTTSKSITGTDTGTVNSGATLQTSGTSISWSGPSAAPGVTINNSGTILSTGSRGIDTSGSNTTRNITLNNNAGALIQGDNDGFRVNSDVVNSTVTVNNSGTIRSLTGQALDFNSISSATATVAINNLAGGVIEAAEADAIRPGQSAMVDNAGTICVGSFSGGVCSGGIVGESHDGVDFQSHSGSVINQTGGLISGQHHGMTSDVDINVTNNAGALIEGRNGSGVGSDGTGTVLNYGTIRGSWDGVATDGDGDGVDIDFTASVTNYGIIKGVSAAGTGSDGHPNGADGMALGGGTVDNMSGARVTGGNNGVLVDDSSTGGAFSAMQITNAGTIEGLDGYGIRIVGTHADIVTNSGTIAGTTAAVDLGGGDDQLKLSTGSIITGLADGGDDFDTIEITGEVTLGENVNFESLLLNADAILTMAFEFDIGQLLGAVIDGNEVTNIAGNGFNFYYDGLDAANAYLGGLTYQLAGGGQLISSTTDVAVPAPAAIAIFAPALFLLAGVRRRQAALRAA